MLGVTNTVDSGADVVPGGGEVHVGNGVAGPATGHVTPWRGPDRLVPGNAGLGLPGRLAPQTDGVPLPRRHLAAPRNRGDPGRH